MSTNKEFMEYTHEQMRYNFPIYILTNGGIIDTLKCFYDNIRNPEEGETIYKVYKNKLYCTYNEPQDIDYDDYRGRACYSYKRVTSYVGTIKEIIRKG